MDNEEEDEIFPVTPWIPKVELTDPSSEVPTIHEFKEELKLFEDKSWTKTVPYKNWHRYLKPSENIGSLFTPIASRYHLKTLTKHAKRMRWHPFPDGKLTDPPHECIQKHREEMQKKAMEKHEKYLKCLPENIINLRDLADDTWLRKRAAKQAAMKLEDKREKRTKKGTMKKKIAGKPILYAEAEIAKSVEEQLSELKRIVEEEQTRIIRQEDIDKIVYLRNTCINDDDLEMYDYSHIAEARNRIIGKLKEREDFDEKLQELEPEIIEGYKDSLRCAIVDYILSDINERKRLQIVTFPVEYPTLNVRAPIPWHQAKVIAEHFMQHNLVIGNEILRDIRDLYFSK